MIAHWAEMCPCRVESVGLFVGMSVRRSGYNEARCCDTVSKCVLKLPLLIVYTYIFVYAHVCVYEEYGKPCKRRVIKDKIICIRELCECAHAVQLYTVVL